MQQKIATEDLQLGMYVAELDRPWLDSPFLFQGFIIDSEEDLAKLRETCRFVYVDAERSTTAPEARAPASGAVTKTDAATSFRTEHAKAVQEHRVASTRVIKMLDDIRLGQSITTEEARTVVGSLINVISRNANTAMWLTHLRRSDSATADHCLNVSILAIAFARHLNMPKEEIAAIGIGALLHDMGLARLPPEILQKQGELNEAEYARVKQHPLEGETVLKLTKTLPTISLQIVRWHHERLDGSGYPDGIKGEQIPRAALVTAIADAYESMTSPQPYRAAMTPQDALAELRKSVPLFGAQLIQEFIRCVGIYPIGSLVLLSTGVIGVVVASNPGARLMPVVMQIRDADGKEMRQRPLLNLATTVAHKQEAVQISRVLNPQEYGVDISALVEDTHI